MKAILTDKKRLDGLERYEVIAPLLLDDLDRDTKAMIRRLIMKKYEVSDRTIRRWTEKYEDLGFEGLIQRDRITKGSSKIPEQLLKTAIELRQELPTRSVESIITILIGENAVRPNGISRSTLSRQLAQSGYGKDYKKTYADEVLSPSPARRFEHEHRNNLWQMDLKYAVPVIGEDGKPHNTYILAFIDDATRMIVHAEIYDTQKLPILEDGFRKALIGYGKPDAVLIDNGKIFVSRWFKMACANLRIRHIPAAPYSPKTKGKIEKFNQLCDSFLQEISIEPPMKLLELNRKFRFWLEEAYTNKPHSALKDDKTPHQAFRDDPRKIKYLTPEKIHEVFLWEKDCKVDKVGVIKLEGNQYDAGGELARKVVQARYDPFDLKKVAIYINGLFVKEAGLLKIDAQLPAKQVVKVKTKVATHSRLLAVFEKENAERDKVRNAALRFNMSEEEE